LVNPQTSGVVFRYCTMEMRSFGKVGVFFRALRSFAPFGEGPV
jgi:hypothetical protein